MAVYARSDMMSVSIPVTSGGCGATHTRPVTHGVPVRIWKLDCDPCGKYLRGDYKSKVIHVHPGDKDKGIPGRTEHVPDADPHWSVTPEAIPLTPDEQHIHKLRAEQGQRQLDRLTAFAALKQSGMKIPPQAQWLIDSTLEEIATMEKMNLSFPVAGMMLCLNGHENTPGTKFCPECGIAMAVQGEISPAEEMDAHPVRLTSEPEFDLRMLHIATLRKKCREKGLNDKGTKTALIERLETAKA